MQRTHEPRNANNILTQGTGAQEAVSAQPAFFEKKYLDDREVSLCWKDSSSHSNRLMISPLGGVGREPRYP